MTIRVLYLARHGETDWNRERRWQGHADTELNDVGRAQAEVLAKTIEGHGVARIHTSDLRRARETAEIVARRLGIASVISDTDLRERNFGVFEGLTFAECEQKYPEMWARYLEHRTRPEGAEPDQALVERMRRGMRRALDGNGTVLVVTHGGAMRAYLHATGAASAMDDGLALPNGAVVRLEFRL